MNLDATEVIHKVFCEVVGIAIDFVCKVGHGSVIVHVGIVERVFKLHWGVRAVFNDDFLSWPLGDGVVKGIRGWRRRRTGEWLGWRGCGWRGRGARCARTVGELLGIVWEGG